MKRIAIDRPGACGDILMILNSLPKLREKYDEIDFYCHRGTGHVIGSFLQKSGLINRFKTYWSKEHRVSNPESYDKLFYPIGYPVEKEGYPNYLNLFEN